MNKKVKCLMVKLFCRKCHEKFVCNSSNNVTNHWTCSRLTGKTYFSQSRTGSILLRVMVKFRSVERLFYLSSLFVFLSFLTQLFWNNINESDRKYSKGLILGFPESLVLAKAQIPTLCKYSTSSNLWSNKLKSSPLILKDFIQVRLSKIVTNDPK